jgi:hypothetical protein
MKINAYIHPPCLLLGLLVQHSFCDKILGFYLHVYKGKNILQSQVPTLGSKFIWLLALTQH